MSKPTSDFSEVKDFKKRLAALSKKLAKFWECPNCHRVNHKDGFYCEECRTRNIATYG